MNENDVLAQLENYFHPWIDYKIDCKWCSYFIYFPFSFHKLSQLKVMGHKKDCFIRIKINSFLQKDNNDNLFLPFLQFLMIMFLESTIWLVLYHDTWKEDAAPWVFSYLISSCISVSSL